MAYSSFKVSFILRYQLNPTVNLIENVQTGLDLLCSRMFCGFHLTRTVFEFTILAVVVLLVLLVAWLR